MTPKKQDLITPFKVFDEQQITVAVVPKPIKDGFIVLERAWVSLEELSLKPEQS